MSESPRERVARNQAAFRTVNEGIAAGREDSGRPQPFVCECAIVGCTELIMLTADEYEAVPKGMGVGAVRASPLTSESELLRVRNCTRSGVSAPMRSSASGAIVV